MKNFFAPSAWRLGGAVRRAATALLLCVLTMTVQTAWAQSGNWSDYKAASFSTINESAKTISITSEAELALLAYNTCNGIDYTGYTITLTKDLKMSDHYWDKSIGNSYDNCFRGTFNGDNKTISGINISSGAYKGLFGYVGQSENPGTIQNVTLASSTIIGKAYVGGIVGYLQYGTVSNCHVLSSVSILASADDSNYFGGIVGQTYPNKTVSSATIENCTSAASVTDNGHNNCSNYGGIVGYNYYYSDTHFSTVTGCFYYGTAVSASSNAGAIVGSYWYSNGISNCYYNCPSTISGIGYGNTDIGTTRVYKLTLGTGTTSLNVSGNATYTHNGIKYYAAGTTATVATTDNTQVILALSATSGTISNLSIANDKHSATFTMGSSDVTLGGTVKTISGTCGNNGNVTWSLGGTNYTELTISGTGTMQNFEYSTDGIWKTKAPWGTDITKVTIGDGVTSIGNYAFIGCENLASITIGSGVTSIGIGAINHCDQMTSVTLPASVTTIAYAAFENCQKLETIYINHDGEVSLTGNYDNAFNAPLLQYIAFSSPAGALANTKETGNWARYKDNIRARFGNQLFTATNEGGTAAYNIATETDLRNLATAVNGGANGSGQTFRQTDGITMTGGNFTPIGSSQTNYFGGTYDGGGKTLTVNISDTQNQGTALFRNIQGATIKNLLLSGSVTGTIHAATLVGFSRGTNTIDRCKVASNVTVTTPSGTNYHCGGLVGHALTSNLTISNTVYCGTITNSGNFVGGLQGWCDNGNTISITNCLFAGSYQGTATGTASFHPIAVRGKNSAATVTATNTYYEVIPSLGDYQYIAADGKKATAATSAPSNLGSLVETLSYMTIYQNGILFNGKYYAAPVLSTDNSGAYIINSAANWTAFCDMLYDNLTYNRFTGKTVKLGADITVSRMAGVDYHDFCGTFDGGTTDGGRHTLTFTATATDNYLAPFCNVLGNSSDEHAVIRNLKVVTNITADDYRHTAGLMAKAWGYVDVNNCDITANITATKGSQTDLYPAGITSQVTSGTQLTVSGCTVGGTIETNGKYAAGYVGILQGSASIQNSVSSVNIQSSTSGDGIHGGFVAVVNNGQSLTIEGCLFNGKIVTTNGTTNCGGFVGHDKGTGVTITNSLYAPTTDDNTVSEGCATFGRNVADANITNCYYTQAFGEAQGTAARTVSAGEFVTTCTVSPVGNSTNSYNVSDITAYNDGLVRGSNFYYGNTDVVSLTLAHQEREGYIFEGYTATPESATLSGEANPYSLTMPDANVTIGATFSFLSIAYIDENGQQQFCTEYTVLSEDFHSYLYAGQWYVVKDDIEYYDNFETWGNGAANIILVDGKTCSIFAGYGFRAIKGNVNIYGQSLGTGTLNLTGGDELIDPEENSYSQSAIFGNIAVYGGIVTANSGEYQEVGPDPAIRGNVVCRRGKLTANIGDYAIMGSTVDFSGGELTANGIIHSDVTINWTNSSDRFYANSLSNSVTISNGKAFCYTDNTGLHILGPGPDNGDYILSAEEKAAIAGKTLYPAVAITLSEGITAVSGIIANGDGNYAKVGETVTISATAPLGYTPTVTYTPEGGEATVATYLGNGTYSFTVPAANVSVDTDALHSTGQPVSVTYMNADGTTGTHEAIALDETMTTLAGGWYFVGKDIAYNSTITLNGDVTIILADGKTMSVGTSDTPISGDAIKGEIGNWPNHYYYALTVYGQSLAESTAGTLSLHTSSVGIYVKAYTQHSGKVSITSVYNSGIWTLGDAVTINGGHLDVNVGNVAIFAYSDVIINGGTVNATGQGEGISSSNNGNITLGWTNTSDYIYANSYETTGTIAIASGQAFIDENNVVYSGTVNASDLNGKTLHPIDGCLPPSHLTATDITTTTATLTWTSDAEDFDMEYAINPVFTFDFDDGTLQGWTNLIVNQDGGMWLHSDDFPTTYDYNELAHSGTGFALCYSYVEYSGVAYNTNAYLVSPQSYQIYEGASLTFFYNQRSETWPEYFEVCVATAANPTASDFSPIWNLNSRGGRGQKTEVRQRNTRYENWREVTLDLSAYTGQTIWIAFHDVNNSMYEVWIDDVTINTGNITWIPVNESISTNQYTLTGLAPKTTYLVRVRANCDADDVSLWSNIATFTTLDPCEAPSELTATDITVNSATLSWSGVQDSYNVRYRSAARANEWQTINNIAGTTTTLNGLTPETPYQWQVQGLNCDGDGGTTDWSAIGEFTTQPLPAVSYIDENGEQQLCTAYTTITSSMSSYYDFTAGWYVVNSDVEFNSQLYSDDEIHLILCDGATLTVTEANYGININTLHIYGQALGTGTINAQGTSNSGIYIKNSLTINGGIINAQGKKYGIYAGNSVTINGGQVTANGQNNNGIRTANDGSNITINGGQVTAISGNSYGISCNVGAITLGWTNPTDYIYANSYNATATLSIAEGKAFITEDGIAFESGTVNASAINGKKLLPYIEGSVPYLDENGQRQLCTEYTVLDGTETTLAAGWYVADGTLDYDHTITLSGDVHIILKDNAVMSVGTEQSRLYTSIGDYNNAHSLNIYGQSTGDTNGQLNVFTEYLGILIMEGDFNCSSARVTIDTYGYGIYTVGNTDKENINLKDVTLTVNSSQYSTYEAILAYGGNITITGGAVTVEMDEREAHGIVANGGSISITDAIVNTNGKKALYTEGGDLTINGGEVTATGTECGIYVGGNLVINGGKVTSMAMGTQTYAKGIRAIYDITLGWTNATDFIQANSYDASGTISIAEGKAFIDEAGQTYSGTVAKVSGAYAIDGKTLRPYSNSMLFLADDADNTAIISKFNGQTYNVTLAGRKLWKDGAWNTLVLPFAIANIEADGCPLKGATVRELNDASITGTTLNLTFKNATTEIAAGVPYIVKWDGGTDGQYTENPVFQGVTIDATDHSYDNQAGGDTNVRFIGTYDQKTVNTEDQSILFLGAANTLYYPSGQSATTIGACRAYFKIGSGTALARQLTAFNLNFADGESQGIVDNKRETITNNHWYTLDGVRLDAQPTRKGLYIHGGRKVVIK